MRQSEGIAWGGGGEWCVTLGASDVPLAFMTKLHLVVARIDESLRLLASRIIRTSRGAG